MKPTAYDKAPDRVLTYFALEKWNLAVITASGILYNVGMVAGPWFEGQLVQRLFDIMGGKKAFPDMLRLAAAYILVILVVQAARFIKRLYVRKFANNINRNMKQTLYRNIVYKSRLSLRQDGTGSIMTKAISDVDTCAEGMRKFTTEVFDTGVVMVAYLVMLLLYDWRLALLSMIFPPIAYLIAEKLKKIVSACAAAYKKSAGQLNTATLDRVTNAMTYRVYGQEARMDALYEQSLTEYEKKSARANIWETALQPIYQIISSLSVVFILWFGAKNVLGTGWAVWDIAAFTTFLSCFMKLAVKASKSAKLFNAVQKARVSWGRIKPYLKAQPDKTTGSGSRLPLAVQGLSFCYKDGDAEVLHDINFNLQPGQILGVAGSVACGKSTLGKVFLCEEPYRGHILLGGQELSANPAGMTAYLGHQPELISGTIEENILLGSAGDVMPLLEAVCISDEVSQMPQGIHTQIGNGGVTLSGGQQARLALARTLFHRKPIMVLDDPFSAVDLATEQKIMRNMRLFLADRVTLIISHRLTIFPQFDCILWLDGNLVGTHDELLQKSGAYADVYRLQTGGSDNEK